MAALGLARGNLIYPGGQDYSLGGPITALSAEKILAKPQELLRH